MKICKACELYSNDFCSTSKEVNGTKGCGCYIPAKVYVENKDSCPLRKWPK